MKKTLFAALALVMLVGVAIVLPLSSAHAIETFAFETETRIYDPAKSFGGYFMPSQSGGGTTYLMDMMGNIVHKWDGVGGTPQLLANGNLGSRGQLMDWDGNILWAFNPATDPTPVRPDVSGMHHDSRWIWNKKLQQYTNLIVTRRTVTQAEVVAAGGDPSINYGAPPTGITNRLTILDVIIEVNQNKQIVWEWDFMGHTCQSRNPAWPKYVGDVKLAPGKCDIFWRTDASQPDGPEGFISDWQHVNSLDYNEDLDLIAVNARQWSTFYVIDHGKTFVSTTNWAANKAAAAGPDGDFIYRFGNPSAYNQGKAPSYYSEGHHQMYGSHNIQWIRPYHWERPHPEAGVQFGTRWTWPDPVGWTKSGIANPGAGNFLIYDNGLWNMSEWRRSKILEINPYLNATGVNTGAFVNPPDAGYTQTARTSQGGTVGYRQISKQIVWKYEANRQNSFYSSHISGMSRLPNGNTSIMAGNQGHMFEVTPTGEVVWEYVNPGVVGAAKTIVKDGEEQQMFRHYRYGNDYPGLAGKDLTPQGTITGRIPSVVGSGITYPKPVTYFGFGFGASGSTVGGGGGIGGGTGGGTGY